MQSFIRTAIVLLGFATALGAVRQADADWRQLQGGPLRSGDAANVELPRQMGLVASAALTDGIFASPVVSDGNVVVIDGSGVVAAFDAATLKELWRFETKGGDGNCNNVAAPAIIDNYVHVGTMAGYYYVLNLKDGKLVSETDCGEPIFSAPAANDDRVYFATLGAHVFAVTPKGKTVWTWDFVKEVIKFEGNRWSGADWLAHRKDRVTWKDHFVCSRDICLVGNTIVMPAGGRTIFLEVDGVRETVRLVGINAPERGECLADEATRWLRDRIAGQQVVEHAVAVEQGRGDPLGAVAELRERL